LANATVAFCFLPFFLFVPSGGFGFAYILCFFAESGGSDLNCGFFSPTAELHC
jgi:hypothetical protein